MCITYLWEHNFFKELLSKLLTEMYLLCAYCNDFW